jgi:ATP-dependent DNA helicase RecG
MAERVGPRSCSRFSRGSRRWTGSARKRRRTSRGWRSRRRKDLLLTLPQGGIDRALKASIRDVAICPARQPWRSRSGATARPRGAGPTGWRSTTRPPFELVFFHARGDYLQRLLPTGARRVVSGRVELFDGVAQMAHPDHVLPPEEAGTLPAFEPVYPLTARASRRRPCSRPCALGAGPAAGAARVDRRGAQAAEGLAGLARGAAPAHAPEGPETIALTRSPRRGSGWPMTS